MKILKIILSLALILSDISPVFAEIVFDQPAYQPPAVRPSFRSPQEIIADFQASVDKIQREQDDLYGQIESKNKENAFLLRKINELSVKLLALDYSLAKRASKDGQDMPQDVIKLTEEKEMLLRKYDQALSQKLALESEIKKLNSEHQSVEETVQASVGTLKEALNASQKKAALYEAQIESLTGEKEKIEQERSRALEEMALLEGRVQGMETQIQDLQRNAAQAAVASQSPAQKRVRELGDRVDQLREDLKEKDRLIAEAKKKESASLLEFKKKDKQNEDLRAQLQRAISTYNAAQEARAAKIAALEAAIIEKQVQIQRLSGEEEEKSINIRQPIPDVKPLNDQIARLNKDLASERSSLEQKVKKATEPLMLQIKDLQKTLKEKNVSLSKKNNELKSLKEKSKTISMQLAEAQKQKETLGRSVESLRKRMNDSGESLGDKDKSMAAQMLSMRQELDKRDDLLEEESRLVDELKEKNKELSLSLDEVRHEKELLQNEVASYKSRLSGDKSAIKDMTEAVRKEYEQKISFLSVEIKELTEKLKEQEKKTIAQAAASARQKEQMEGTIASLTEKLDRGGVASTAMAEHKEQGVRQKDQIEELALEKEKIREELKKADEERVRFENELAELKVKFDSLEKEMPEKLRQVRAPLEETIAGLKKQLNEQTEIINDKKRELTELKGQNHTLEFSLKKNDSEREDLREQLVGLENLLEASKVESGQGKAVSAASETVEAISKELEKTRSQLKDKDSLIDGLRAKNENLASRLTALEEEKSQAELSAQRLGRQLQDMKAINKDLAQDADDPEEKLIQELKNSLAESKKALQEKENIVKTLNAKITDTGLDSRRLKDESVELRNALADAEKEKSRLQDEVGSLQGVLDVTKRELMRSTKDFPSQTEDLQKERDEIRAKLNEVIRERDFLKMEIETNRKEYKSVLVDAKGYETEINGLKAQKTELERQLDDASKRAVNFEKTISNLNVQIEEFRKDRPPRVNEDVLAQWKKKTQDMSDELRKSRERSSELERSVKTLQEKNRKLNALVETTQETLSNKDKSLAVLEASQKDLLARSANFDKERQGFEARIKDLGQQVALQTKGLGSATSAKEFSSQRTADLTKKLEEARGELRTKEETIGQMVSRQSSLEGQLNDALLAKSKAETAAKQTRVELESLRTDFEIERSKLKDESQRFGQERDDQIIKVNELHNALKESQNQSQITLQESRGTLLKEIEGLKQQLNNNEMRSLQLETVNKQLSQTKADLIQQLTASQTKQKDLQSKFDEWKNAITDKETQNRKAIATVEQELTEKLDAVTAQLADSQRRADELAKIRNELDDKIKIQIARIADLEFESSGKDKELLEKRVKETEEFALKEKNYQAQIADLTSALERSQKTADELVRSRTTLENELKAQETKVAGLESRIDDDRKSLAEAQERSTGDLASAQKKFEEKIAETTKELAASKDTIGQMTKTRDELERSLKEARDKVEQLSQDLSQSANDWEMKLSEQQAALKASQEQTSRPLLIEIDDLKEQINTSTAQIESLTSQNKELTQAREGLTRQLAEALAREKENQIKMAGVQEAMLNKGAQDRQALISMEKDLTAKIDEITTQLSLSVKREAELNKSREELQKDLKAKQDIIAKLEIQTIEQKNQLDMVENKSRNDIAAVRKSLDNQIEQLNTKIQDYENIIADLTKSKESAESSLKQREARVAELQQKVIENEKIENELKAQSLRDVASVKEASTARIDELTNSKRLMTDQIQKLTADLQSSRKSVDDLINARELLEGSIEVKDGQVTDLQAQLKDEQATVASLAKIREDLQVALKAAETKLTQLSTQLSDKEAALRSLETGVSSQIAAAKKPLEDKMDILVKSLGDAQTEVKTQQGKIEGLTGRISGLERSLNEANTAKADLERSSEQSRVALEKMRKDLTVEVQKANKPLQERNQLLQVESEDKTKKITALTAERDRLSQELAKLTEEGRKLQQEITLLKQETANLKRTMEQNAQVVKAPLLAQIGQMQRTIDEKELLIEQKAEAFSKVNEELATVLRGLAVIREERDKMSALVKPLQEQVKGIPQEVALAKVPLEEENSRLKLELAKVQGMLDVRVQGLEADLTRRAADYEKAEAGRRTLQKETERLSQANDELSRDMEKIQLKLSKKFQEDCGVALEEIQKPWKDKIDQFKSLIEGKDKEIESFKTENLRLNRELEEALNISSVER